MMEADLGALHHSIGCLHFQDNNINIIVHVTDHGTRDCLGAKTTLVTPSPLFFCVLLDRRFF
jgi:hypothetical protein